MLSYCKLPRLSPRSFGLALLICFWEKVNPGNLVIIGWSDIPAMHRFSTEISASHLASCRFGVVRVLGQGSSLWKAVTWKLWSLSEVMRFLFLVRKILLKAWDWFKVAVTEGRHLAKREFYRIALFGPRLKWLALLLSSPKYLLIIRTLVNDDVTLKAGKFESSEGGSMKVFHQQQLKYDRKRSSPMTFVRGKVPKKYAIFIGKFLFYGGFVYMFRISIFSFTYP